MFLKRAAVFFTVAFMAAGPVSGQQLELMPGHQEEDEVVATVDGEEIHMSQLEEAARVQQISFQMMQINPQFGQFLQTAAGQELMDEYRRFALDNLINETLLSQKAGREGIEVSEAEIEEHFSRHVEEIKAQQDITEQELVQALQQQGVSSLDEYRQIFVEHSNLEEQKLLEEAGVEDADVEEYVQRLREEADIEIHL